MNKKNYTKPLAELDNITMDDVICSSGTNETFGNGWVPNDETTWTF